MDSLGRTYTQTSKEKSGCTLSRMYRSGQLTIKPISAKTKERLHNARKEYLATHRVKYNWNGPLPKLSYAEQYFYDNLKSYKTIDNCSKKQYICNSIA